MISTIPGTGKSSLGAKLQGVGASSVLFTTTSTYVQGGHEADTQQIFVEWMNKIVALY